MKALKCKTVSRQEAGRAIRQAAANGLDLRVKRCTDGRAYLVQAGKEAMIYEQ